MTAAIVLILAATFLWLPSIVDRAARNRRTRNQPPPTRRVVLTNYSNEELGRITTEPGWATTLADITHPQETSR